MNSPMTTLIRPLRVSSVVVWLALVGALAIPLDAQDVKPNASGGKSEQAGTNIGKTDLLPPAQAANPRNRHDPWSTIPETAALLALFATPVGIVARVLGFRHRRQRLAHETMRLMIEKGLPVPPELINPPPSARPPQNDLRRGLVQIALGIGLIILLQKVEEDAGIWAVGPIPTFIGAAYLLSWIIGLVRQGREAGHERNDLWPGIFWTLLGASLILAMFALKRASGEWDELCAWWGIGLIPIGVGLAFLLHGLVS